MSVEIFNSLENERHRKVVEIYSKWIETARSAQILPIGDWFIWLILAGRGYGKTRVGAENVVHYACRNPNSRQAVVATTYGDVRDVCFEGESGIMSILPSSLIKAGRGNGSGYNAHLSRITLWNGAQIKGYSAREPSRLRGPQHHRAWCDEVSSWEKSESFSNLIFGLRLGHDPRCIITTTPKANALTRSIVERKNVLITRGSTFDNVENLAPSFIEEIKDQYEGTRIGRQEMHAELLNDVEGALWTSKNIEEMRVKQNDVPELVRIVVAIDPAVTSHQESSETGIIVAGIDEYNHCYVLEDVSVKGTPQEWAKRAVFAYHDNEADLIVGEVNNGGDMIQTILKTIDNSIPYKKVRASRGKLSRAEPVSALYEQGRIHHVGFFKELEDQMTTYTGASSDKSPDRLDALVWAISTLRLKKSQHINALVL